MGRLLGRDYGDQGSRLEELYQRLGGPLPREGSKPVPAPKMTEDEFAHLVDAVRNQSPELAGITPNRVLQARAELTPFDRWRSLTHRARVIADALTAHDVPSSSTGSPGRVVQPSASDASPTQSAVDQGGSQSPPHPDTGVEPLGVQGFGAAHGGASVADGEDWDALEPFRAGDILSQTKRLLNSPAMRGPAVSDDDIRDAYAQLTKKEQDHSSTDVSNFLANIIRDGSPYIRTLGGAPPDSVAPRRVARTRLGRATTGTQPPPGSPRRGPHVRTPIQLASHGIRSTRAATWK